MKKLPCKNQILDFDIKKEFTSANEVTLDTKVSTPKRSKPKRRKATTAELAQRHDVVRKTILRSIKRYFLKIFREKHPAIVKKRYAQADPNVIFDAMLDVCAVIFGPIPNLNSITQFVMIYSGIKPREKYPYDPEIEKRGVLVESCMYKYSVTKFTQILKVPEFQQILKVMFENNYSEIVGASGDVKKGSLNYTDVYETMAEEILTFINQN